MSFFNHSIPKIVPYINLSFQFKLELLKYPLIKKTENEIKKKRQ